MRPTAELIRDIITILDSIQPGADSAAVFFEVGRAIGTAKLALIAMHEPIRKESRV